MTRLQKRCFLFSVTLHGALLAVLVASSAFRPKPEETDIPILTMIPANILDRAGADGGGPAATPPQQSQPAPQMMQAPRPQPVRRAQPAPPKPVVQEKTVEPEQPVEPKHQAVEPEPTPKDTSESEPAPKPRHKPHEIHPDFTPASTVTSKAKTKAKLAEEAAAEEAQAAEASAATQARMRGAIRSALNNLAKGVQNSGAQGTVVDLPGQGGGEAFAGYETVIYNVYFHAWVAPDSVASRTAATGVKIVVARDGTIISSEIVNKSGDSALDKSVARTLRIVTRLPPFPAGAHDEQRSFIIVFKPTTTEGSG
jgi:TonB family protein